MGVSGSRRCKRKRGILGCECVLLGVHPWEILVVFGFVLTSLFVCEWSAVVKGWVLLVLATGHGGMEVVESWVAWVVVRRMAGKSLV